MDRRSVSESHARGSIPVSSPSAALASLNRPSSKISAFMASICRLTNSLVRTISFAPAYKGRAMGFWTKISCNSRLAALSETSTGGLPECRILGAIFAASKSRPFSEWRVIHPKPSFPEPDSGTGPRCGATLDGKDNVLYHSQFSVTNSKVTAQLSRKGTSRPSVSLPVFFQTLRLSPFSLGFWLVSGLPAETRNCLANGR
jgi:hypothetical protein